MNLGYRVACGSRMVLDPDCVVVFSRPLPAPPPVVSGILPDSPCLMDREVTRLDTMPDATEKSGQPCQRWLTIFVGQQP
jgi:hypothetical protein